MSGTKNRKYTDEWLNASGNENIKNFVSGGKTNGKATTAVLPEDATREEQDIANIYQNAYNNAIGIEQRAQQAELDAYKAQDLSAKYLAAQNKASGLGGLGVADTSALRLSSQYQNALSEANATRAAELQKNFQTMQNDVNTVRGEWASREEAKAETKYENAEANLSNFDDKTAVSSYLNALGYEKGSNEYNSLLGVWQSMYGRVYDAEKDKTILNEALSFKDLNSVINLLRLEGYYETIEGQSGKHLNERGQEILRQWRIANPTAETAPTITPKKSYSSNAQKYR